MQDITVKTFQKLPKKLNNPVCIQGLPDISSVGTEAVKQIAEGLNAQKVIELGFSDLPPIIIINDGIPHLPAIEISFWKDPRNRQDVFLITGDDQPMTSRGIYIVTLGAYIVESPPRNGSTKIYVATTHKEAEPLKNLLNLPNAKPMAEGEILGANGIVPALAKQKYNIDGAIILSETSAQLASIGTDDPKAIKTLVETVKKYFNLPIKNNHTKEQTPQATQEPVEGEYRKTKHQSSYIC
ncbi:MAG: PAC2 family protein [Candidatus Freyarchaeota archaeon]